MLVLNYLGSLAALHTQELNEHWRLFYSVHVWTSAACVQMPCTACRPISQASLSTVLDMTQISTARLKRRITFQPVAGELAGKCFNLVHSEATIIYIKATMWWITDNSWDVFMNKATRAALRGDWKIWSFREKLSSVSVNHVNPVCPYSGGGG